MVGMGTSMAGASCGPISNTKPPTNAQTVCGRPTPNGDDGHQEPIRWASVGVHFERGRSANSYRISQMLQSSFYKF